MRALEWLIGVLWWLRHPSTRRCPHCRLTWESRALMRMQGGVCHDCFDPWTGEGVVTQRQEGAA